MRNYFLKTTVLLCIFCLTISLPAGGLMAQLNTQMNSLETASSPSITKAVLLSLVMPGLGHRYVHQNTWTGKAKMYFTADLALILGYAGTEWREGAVVESYQTLASTHAGGLTDQGRQYYLNLSQYQNADLYADALLRNRQWQKLDALNDPANQWSWDTEQNWERFQNQRLNAESLTRTSQILVTALIANRIFASIGAAIQANRLKNGLEESAVSTAGISAKTTRRRSILTSAYLRIEPVNGEQYPVLQMNLRW